MNDNDLIQNIEHVDVSETTPAPITYNFDRSMNKLIETFKLAYTNEGVFYEKSACKALESLNEGLALYPDAAALFDDQQAILNTCKVVEENPEIVNTLGNQQLMAMFGKYMSRSDINKPNGQFDPMSIFRSAREDFGLDLTKNLSFMGMSINESVIESILEKL
jgi:hypothetical protein